MKFYSKWDCFSSQHWEISCSFFPTLYRALNAGHLPASACCAQAFWPHTNPKLGHQSGQRLNSDSNHTMRFPIALFNLSASYLALLRAIFSQINIIYFQDFFFFLNPLSSRLPHMVTFIHYLFFSKPTLTTKWQHTPPKFQWWDWTEEKKQPGHWGQSSSALPASAIFTGQRECKSLAKSRRCFPQAFWPKNEETDSEEPLWRGRSEQSLSHVCYPQTSWQLIWLCSWKKLSAEQTTRSFWCFLCSRLTFYKSDFLPRTQLCPELWHIKHSTAK